MNMNKDVNPKLSIYPAIIISSIVINLMALSIPIFSMQIYDRVLLSNNIYTLSVLAILAALAIFIELGLRILREIALLKVSKVLSYQDHIKVTDKISILKMEVLEEYSNSELLELYKSIEKINAYTKLNRAISVIDVFFIFIYVMVIYYLAPLLALIPIVLISIFAILGCALNKRISDNISSKEAIEEKKYLSVIEILKGFTFIKANGLEEIFKRKFEKDEISSASISKENAGLSLLIFNLTGLIPQLNLVVMTAVGAIEVIDGKITMGALIACVIISGRLAQPIYKAIGLWLKRKELNMAESKIKKFMSGEEIEKLSVDIRGRHSVIFEHVYYEAKDGRILDVNFSLDKGDSISITEATNLEKNILVKLICGAYQPMKGSITLNDIPPHVLLNNTFSENVAYLTHDDCIIKGTIYENITRFDKSISEAEVYEVCKLLGIHDEILKLNAGYQTEILNHQSDVITPGLKQLIAIVRSLVLKPGIVIYNHAEKNLDATSYNHLYQFLVKVKPHTAQIIITHDKNIASIADTHYQIEHGYLVETNYDYFEYKRNLIHTAKIFGGAYGDH